MRQLLAASALTVASFTSTTATAAVVDLGFVLDGSGSVGDTNFAQVSADLSVALGSIPTSGDNEYRIAVVEYGSSVATVVPPTIVTAANIAGIQNTVANNDRIGGGTNTSGAITFAFNLFDSIGLGDLTLLNVATDGQPNSQANVEAASLAAFNGGLDSLGFEAIGSFSQTNLDNLAIAASLGTRGVAGNSVIVNDPDNLPNVLNTGFVLAVDSFDAFGAAIEGKVQEVITDVDPDVDPNVVPLPAGLPLLLTGLAGFFGIRRMRKT